MFEFDGMVFRPYRNFKNTAEGEALVIANHRVIKKNFNYEAFYKAAEKAGEMSDTYYADGVKCIPCSRVLIELNERKDYSLTELGYFSLKEYESLKDKLNGRTYMNFHLGYSNRFGNITLVVSTDYDATEEEVKNLFLSTALSELARR